VGQAELVLPEMKALSCAQQALWFLDQMSPGNTAYIFQADYEITGTLDVPALRRALDYIASRHEVLRSRIAVRSGTPYSVIEPPGRAVFDQVDMRESTDPRGQAMRALAERERTPLDLAAGPLFRSAILRLGEESWILHIKVHHAVFDGESHRIFEQELAAAYECFTTGVSPRLPPLPLTYAEFAAAQNSWLVGAEAAAEIGYWARRLAGVGQTELPSDRPRRQAPGFAAGEVKMWFPADTARRVTGLARELRTTFFVVLLAAYQYMLSRYVGGRDIVVGTPFLGRPRPELEHQIGFFANTLALRCEIRDDLNFTQLIGRARDTVLDAADHQGVPFERIVASLAPERDERRNPVFQNWFDAEDADPQSLSLTGVGCRRIVRTAVTTPFDTEFHVAMAGGALRGRLVYSTELFDQPRMQQLAGHFVALAGALAGRPHEKLAGFSLLSVAQAKGVIELGATPAPGTAARPTLAEWLEDRAAADPGAVAVTDGRTKLTYGELLEQADRIASRLRASGAGPESVVGVCMPRTSGLVAVLAGVVRAGAAYLPMDPELPASRLGYMLADTAATHVVTCAAVRHLIEAGTAHVLCTDELGADEIPPDGGQAPARSASSDNALYVIYTSGSTGKPKGVVITHRSFCNLVGWHLAAYGGQPGEHVVSAVANLAFDAAGWEIWSALLGGARLDIVPAESAADPEALITHLRRAGTTEAFAPTPLAEQLIRMPLASRTRLDYLLTGGDVFRPRPADAPGVPVFNHYGPTETAVVATAGGALGPPWHDISIGRPIAGVRAYVLDRCLHPVPLGASGELFIGGTGVGRGYLGRPALTAERFVPDPFAPYSGARMYRTGDLVRWRQDGTLAFEGRADRQVKIRGLRIEPGEIESAILGFPDVREVAIVQTGHNLAAYLTTVGSALTDTGALREYLRARLPEYMVPAAFVVLESMPLSPNGKVDRLRLPDPGLTRPAFVAPAGPVERAVAAMWSEVLGTDPGADDDFFALGGHSLIAARLVAMIGDLFGVGLSIRTIFQCRTVASLSAAVERQVREEVSRMSDDAVAAELCGQEPGEARGDP
jgi:amino acid adenylation domain-containing protein